MFVFTPSRNTGDAERTLATLVKSRLDPQQFTNRIQRLESMFSVCKTYCPPPWASRNLCVSPEINYQHELWLPLDQLQSHFYSLYRQSLAYPPIFSSTPFTSASSWAAIVAGFPPFLKQSYNPADLLEQLVNDDDLRIKFLFWSFMPERFYGSGADRYPGQSSTISEWARQKKCRGKRLRCLDAASGDGANTYGIARLLIGQGWSPDRIIIDAWTLDPLEAWAAAYGRFPHDPVRETVFCEETQYCFEHGFNTSLSFCSTNILDASKASQFDLILCNGLLGGPIIHAYRDMDNFVRKLSVLLAPGGMMLAADHFHGGWKQKCPQKVLRALLEMNGLLIIEADEGIAALKPDQ